MVTSCQLPARSNKFCTTSVDLQALLGAFAKLGKATVRVFRKYELKIHSSLKSYKSN